MRQFRFYLIGILLVGLLIGTSFNWAEENPVTYHLTILHTNDFHGYDYHNLARQATLVKQIRNAEKNVLLLNAGDLFVRGAYDRVFYGELEFAVANQLRTDALTLGNNEFKATDDFAAQAYLWKLLKQARFPILCANVVLSQNQSSLPDTQPYVVKKIGGLRVGIIGVTTEKIKDYPQIKGFTVYDPIETARAIFSRVAGESDLVIALTHIGVAADRKLAKELPKLAAIVGGDSHTALAKPEQVGEIPIVQAGEYGKFLGRLDLYFEQGDHTWVLKSFQGRLIPIDRNILVDPDVKAIIDRYMTQALPKAS